MAAQNRDVLRAVSVRFHSSDAIQLLYWLRSKSKAPPHPIPLPRFAEERESRAAVNS